MYSHSHGTATSGSQHILLIQSQKYLLSLHRTLSINKNDGDDDDDSEEDAPGCRIKTGGNTRQLGSLWYRSGVSVTFSCYRPKMPDVLPGPIFLQMQFDGF
ncbi:Histone-lysine N-methyltransferase EZH1 [Manis javanica]|nr:Histone-lysine N-methyltransferase EZH1 [Manis javanica]